MGGVNEPEDLQQRVDHSGAKTAFDDPSVADDKLVLKEGASPAVPQPEQTTASNISDEEWNTPSLDDEGLPTTRSGLTNDELDKRFNRQMKLSAELPYGVWSSGARIEASLTALGPIFVGIMLLILILSIAHHAAPPDPSQLPSIDLNGFVKNAYRINTRQIMLFLPFAVLGSLAASVAVAFVAGRSRSRQIDWTDSHMLLEYSGPVSLALKWSSIKSIDQELQWELFHGRQPVFIVRTVEDNVFRLRLSDITQKHNIGEFFSLVKTNAPSAVVNVARDASPDNSYTELWLKYFSAPAAREKTGLLQKDMVLDRGRYVVHGTVGGGGQGTAYLATIDRSVPPPPVIDEETEEDARQSGDVVKHIMQPNEAALARSEQVVLKEYVLPIHRGQLTAERTADKLRAEAEILQKLRHPQIVELQDAFIEDYRGYLVLEFVNGEPLKSLVDRLGPQPESQVIDWAIQICEILHYLHDLSPPVVHRDITPDNLMLQEDGKIKLVDFNVAYQVDSSTTATVVGKHAYIPAEQFRGKPTPQSDVYALGGSMHYLLTAADPIPITQSHPRVMNEHVSCELDAIVAKATANRLHDRFATVDDLALALREIAASLIQVQRD
jgi:tRNA A-37 threonylcarbamoyl transferase component Bud32